MGFSQSAANNQLLENRIMSRIYNVSICSRKPSDTYQLRSDVRAFLENRGDCEVVGAGVNCVDPSYADLAVRFRSKAAAQSSVAALRVAFSRLAQIEISR